MSDFTPYKLSFDAKGAKAAIDEIIDFNLDELSNYLQRTVRSEIFRNGNGSPKVMRLFAAALVEETKREITDDLVTLEVGIKMEGLPEDAFVRVSVVLHGNQGSGPLMTKPGQMTWGKHVIGKSASTAKTAHALPDGFNQDDKFDDILEQVVKNVENESAKYVRAFIRAVNRDVQQIDWSRFLTGGG